MTPPERRLGDRKRVFLRGRIVFNNRSSVIDCMVRDLSSTGAQIVLEHPVSIPSSFELEIPSKSWWLPCEVRWSSLKIHGVMFTRPPPAQGALTASASAPVGVPAPPLAAPAEVPRSSTDGGWLFKVSTPGEPPQVSIFAVAEVDLNEALALLVRQVGVSVGGGFEAVGRVAAATLLCLQLKRGEVLNLSALRAVAS